MGNVEDLNVWQNAVGIAKDIYICTGKNGKISKDFGLRDQIQRSAVSIASNIAEGCNRGSDKDFVRFLYIAKGSCAELKTQLLIANEINYISKDEYIGFNSKLDEIHKMLHGLIGNLSRN
ncbi:MAG TPA: four helix bundle protein [Candidatus Absconditabacterales bacterium]|nr:four helix bundle protein [Candidatus Absconditabacterales bacterium]